MLSRRIQRCSAQDHRRVRPRKSDASGSFRSITAQPLPLPQQSLNTPSSHLGFSCATRQEKYSFFTDSTIVCFAMLRIQCFPPPSCLVSPCFGAWGPGIEWSCIHLPPSPTLEFLHVKTSMKTFCYCTGRRILSNNYHPTKLSGYSLPLTARSNLLWLHVPQLHAKPVPRLSFPSTTLSAIRHNDSSGLLVVPRSKAQAKPLISPIQPPDLVVIPKFALSRPSFASLHPTLSHRSRPQHYLWARDSFFTSISTHPLLSAWTSFSGQPPILYDLTPNRTGARRKTIPMTETRPAPDSNWTPFGYSLDGCGTRLTGAHQCHRSYSFGVRTVFCSLFSRRVLLSLPYLCKSPYLCKILILWPQFKPNDIGKKRDYI
jgi:hypothetical protein